jgi:cytoskeletal protein RodZ
MQNHTKESIMSENWQSRTTHKIRRIMFYVGLLLVVFLLGFGPMWWMNSQSAKSLAEANRQLSLAKMQNSLASAAIAARQRDYETARQAASDFFTSLRTQFSDGVDSALSEAEIASLQPLLTRRDEIITLLAREDTASADLLYDLYVAYLDLMNP